MSCNCCPSDGYWYTPYETTIQYEARLAVPFVGIMGWIAFACETVVGVWLFVMLINGTAMNPHIILGLLLALGAIEFILWCINAARFAPYTQLEPTTGFMIVKNKDHTWALKLMREAQFANDQSHFQGTLFRVLAVLLFFGIFLGINNLGTNAYALPPPVYDNIAVDEHKVASILTALMIGACTMAFSLNLLETQSDFVVRQFAAFNTAISSSTGVNVQVAAKLPASSSTGTKKGGAGLFSTK